MPGILAALGLRGSTGECGHQSASPFRARCTRPAGHSGQHSARGLRWSDDGRISFSRSRGGAK